MAVSAVIMAGATVVASAANYGTNVWLARALNIDEFGDAALVVSSLLLLSAVAVAVQLAASHLRTTGDSTGLATLRRRAIGVALVVGIGVAVVASPLAIALNSASPLSFVFLGASLPWYLAMSVNRGALQGAQRFAAFGSSLVLEAITRLLVTVVALQWWNGAAAAACGMGVSFVVATAHARVAVSNDARTVAGREPHDAAMVNPSTAVGTPLVVLLAAQVLIANGDVIVVSAMAPAAAGVFAAVALIGRLSFPLAWALINVAFPNLANGAARPAAARRVAFAVTGLGVVSVCGTAIAGPFAAATLFGADAASVQPWLVPYAIATGAFGLATVAAVIDVAIGRVRGAALLLVFGIIQTFALAIFATASVGTAVWVQVWVMAAAAASGMWMQRSVLWPERTSSPKEHTDDVDLIEAVER